MISVAQPGTIIGREDNPRVRFEAEAFERLEQLPHGPVDLPDDVAVQTERRLAAKLVAHVQRDVRGVVREIEEEGFVPALLDELQGAFGVPRRQLILIFLSYVWNQHLLA